MKVLIDAVVSRCGRRTNTFIELLPAYCPTCTKRLTAEGQHVA